MAWQKQTKFKAGKKVDEEEKDFTNPIVDSKYLEGFLRDWEGCRERHQVQIEVENAIFEEETQYVFLRAGRKLAKTTTGIDVAWKLSQKFPKSVGYLCYPTIAQGIEVVWEERRLQTCDRKDDLMFEKYVIKDDDNKHILKFANGSFVKLIGTWTEARGRGTQPDFLIYDEVQDCNPDYIEAMDSNLSAKPHSKCIFMGTPPKKRNHYEEWWHRIGENKRGKRFHYTSYDNTSLPHLKEWLDNKKLELLKANKEDVWLREYMAEFCYASSDRVLPNAEFIEKDEIDNLLRHFDYETRIPILAISVHPSYVCAIVACLIPRKTMFVMDHMIFPQIWDQSFSDMYPILAPKVKYVQDFCHKKTRNLVWDESGSFADIVSGFTRCRKDIKWQDRGIPLLREMMVKGKIKFSRDVADFGLECQNLLIDESDKEVQKNYPHICTLAMMVNEYFSQEKIVLSQDGEFDKWQAFRDMGIPCPPKKRGKTLFTFGL